MTQRNRIDQALPPENPSRPASPRDASYVSGTILGVTGGKATL